MEAGGFYVGVDVGTASVRAAFVDPQGSIVNSHSVAIEVYSPRKDYFQQSSTEIWHAVCTCIGTLSRKIEQETKSKPVVLGIGFAATCSLVVIGNADNGVR